MASFSGYLLGLCVKNPAPTPYVTRPRRGVNFFRLPPAIPPAASIKSWAMAAIWGSPTPAAAKPSQARPICCAGVRGQVVPRAAITSFGLPERTHSVFRPSARGRAHDEAAVEAAGFPRQKRAGFTATGALSRPGRSVLQINLRLLLRNP
jgi:hypothetical protein